MNDIFSDMKKIGTNYLIVLKQRKYPPAESFVKGIQVPISLCGFFTTRVQDSRLIEYCKVMFMSIELKMPFRDLKRKVTFY